MNIQQIFIPRAALEWQRNGGSKTETPVTASILHAWHTASLLHRHLSTLLFHLTDVNSVSVDVGDVPHVSVVHVATIFRVEMREMSKFYIYI